MPPDLPAGAGEGGLREKILASGSLRRYDVQAKYARNLSLVSIIPALAAVGLIVRNYDSTIPGIVYSSDRPFTLILLFCLGSAGLLGAISVVLGLSSAGQRRNDKSSQSWIGFFVGSAVVSLCIVMFFAFWKLRVAT